MPRPKIPDQVVKEIQQLWAEESIRSARQVHRIFRQRSNVNISERKVQQIIAELRWKRPRREFLLVEWTPWRDETETPNDSAHLLALDALSLAMSGRHLYQHEAKWGRLLRVALDGLSKLMQLVFVRDYALRESAAYEIGTPTFTADLDALVAYQPWLLENYEIYHFAVITGSIPRLSIWSLNRAWDAGVFWNNLDGDPGLPTLKRYGLIGDLRQLTGLDFGPSLSPEDDLSRPTSNNLADVKEWLGFKVLEYWAGKVAQTGEDTVNGDERNER